MKAEFINREKPDVQITLSYKQAQKLMFVLLRVEGSPDIDDLWRQLDNLDLDYIKGFKVVNQTGIEVVDE